MGFRPFDTAFSFFIGIYGIATLAVVAFLILRDPIWRGKGSNLAQPVPTPIDMALSGNAKAAEKAANQGQAWYLFVKGVRKNGHFQFSRD